MDGLRGTSINSGMVDLEKRLRLSFSILEQGTWASGAPRFINSDILNSFPPRSSCGGRSDSKRFDFFVYKYGFNFSFISVLPFHDQSPVFTLLNHSNMLSTMRRLPSGLPKLQRSLTTATATQTTRSAKREGDISSVFASLSGAAPTPLPQRFATIKSNLIRDNEPALIASWTRLLSSLRSEIEQISTVGSDIIPSIEFEDINNHSFVKPFSHALKKRGVAIIRNVVPPSVALQYKQDIKSYIAANPQTKAFPKDKPAVFELYWSPSQIKARAHPNMIETQKFLMSFWHSSDPEAKISTKHPLVYADRLRIRQPGDAGFALGPHVDGGSVERWEPNGYALGKVYDSILQGRWEEFDPWEASGRVRAESDLYEGAGASSMIRMFQGWLSMSSVGPGEGTLLVNPLFNLATAYYLLRPFFSPITSTVESSSFLDPENWALDPTQTSALQGATMGMAQELSSALHPHLELSKTMVSIPQVEPGDYVAWHADTIHAVDRIHNGRSDSSVLYIPACPLTEKNAEYLVRQREAFLEGTPGPDFPGGEGERGFVGRVGKEDIFEAGGEEALDGMGIGQWAAESESEREIVRATNEIVSL